MFANKDDYQNHETIFHNVREKTTFMLCDECGKTFESPDDFNSLDRCITRGMPSSMIPFPYNNGVRIFQSPGYVVIQLEIVHETRITPLDGAPPGEQRPPPPGWRAPGRRP